MYFTGLHHHHRRRRRRHHHHHHHHHDHHHHHHHHHQFLISAIWWQWVQINDCHGPRTFVKSIALFIVSRSDAVSSFIYFIYSAQSWFVFASYSLDSSM